MPEGGGGVGQPGEWRRRRRRGEGKQIQRQKSAVRAREEEENEEEVVAAAVVERRREEDGREGRRMEQRLAFAFGWFKRFQKRDPPIEPSEGDILVTNLWLAFLWLKANEPLSIR